MLTGNSIQHTSVSSSSHGGRLLGNAHRKFDSTHECQLQLARREITRKCSQEIRFNTRVRDKAAATAAHDGCVFADLTDHLVEMVVKACREWPEGAAGKEEGVVRLLGGGLMWQSKA